MLAEGMSQIYGSKHGGGFQYLAPEIQDPEKFGLVYPGLTTLSDVFAFAFVCTEASGPSLVVISVI